MLYIIRIFVIYSSTKKGENSQRRSVGSADPPLTSKADAHSSNAFIVINLGT